MNWFDKILNSDAGRLAPERARKIVEEAGGSLPVVVDAPSVRDSQDKPPASTELGGGET